MTQRNDASRADPALAVEKAAQPLTSRSIPATPLTAPPAVPQPTPAALAALDETLPRFAALAAKAEAEARRYAKDTPDECWSALEYRRLCEHVDAAMEPFRRACTPETILALLAAARHGAGDTEAETREIDVARACIAIADSVEHTERSPETKEVALRIGNAIRALLGDAARAAHPEGPQHG